MNLFMYFIRWPIYLAISLWRMPCKRWAKDDILNYLMAVVFPAFIITVFLAFLVFLFVLVFKAGHP